MPLRLLAVLLALAVLPARAQTPEMLSDSARVSLLTMLPGDEVYSLFGHSALRIADDALGLDRTYNYGTFDFEQPGFMLRFARGQLDYILDTDPLERVLRQYAGLRRPVIEQPLAVSPAVVRALYARLEANARPENRAYRYDFLFDNCSTRLLDMLDLALADAGEPAVALAPPASAPTFRQMLAPYIAGTPTIALGMNLGIGAPVDRPATAREQTFLPLSLAATFDRATVGGQPLVARRDTLFWVEGAGSVRARPEPVVPLLVGLLGLGWLLSARRPARFGRWGRAADGLLFAAAGVAGLALAFLWLATDHAVTRPNMNVLWAFPGHLGLAVALVRGRLGRGWRVYAWAGAAAAVAALGLHAVGVQVLPLGSVVLAAACAARLALLAARPSARRTLPADARAEGA